LICHDVAARRNLTHSDRENESRENIEGFSIVIVPLPRLRAIRSRNIVVALMCEWVAGFMQFLMGEELVAYNQEGRALSFPTDDDLNLH